MRTLSVTLLAITACTPTPTPAPTPTPSALLGPWTPALLARLAREADARAAGTVDLHPAPDAERGRCVDCPPRDKGWTCSTY